MVKMNKEILALTNNIITSSFSRSIADCKSITQQGVCKFPYR